MALVNGGQLLTKSLLKQGTEIIFFIEGDPFLKTQRYLAKEPIRLLDVRHEQAAAMMAHAYARVTGGKPGVCMAAAGPGVTNLVTGVANAFSDCAPIVVLGGSFPGNEADMGAFQELDQLNMMRPITKWAVKVPVTQRIPEYLELAFRTATSGRPGPVYLDLPLDILSKEVEEDKVNFPGHYPTPARPLGDPALITKAIDLLKNAQRPVLLTGSGIIWSGASDQLREFVDTVGIPLFTTPQGRGVIPEDHPLCLPSARNFALRNADVILVVGTRLNFVFTFGRAPRFDPAVKVIQVDIQPEYISHNRPVDVGIAGDAKMVLGQLIQEARGKLTGWAKSPWLSKLKEIEAQHQAKSKPILESDQIPIHTARLCKEVRDFIPRDAVLAVDGNEILTWARQIINTNIPGHRMNCGPFGCLGVAVPFGIGAKLGKPNAPVFVLSGDGSFGFNGMEMDTAIRHKIPVVVIISNNGSWASMSHDENVPGKYLGHQRYDLMVSAFGGYGELVESPEDIRPALERAVASGKPACLNVITDPYVKSHQSGLLHYEA